MSRAPACGNPIGGRVRRRHPLRGGCCRSPRCARGQRSGRPVWVSRESGRGSRAQCARERSTLRGYARRMSQLSGLSNPDVVICDQEFLPYFPGVTETLVARRSRRVIVDYDDAAYFKYQHIPFLQRKIPALMAAAEAVVVGNRHLAEFAALYNTNVHVIPTVV